MNELQLSNDLTTIETEIKSYQNIAGQSIFEIGRRLKHVKENDLAHGEFMNWVRKIGMSQTSANKFMKIANNPELNSSPAKNLGVTVLYEIATLPEEERNKEHITSSGEVKTPDEMTRKELRELKNNLKNVTHSLGSVFLFITCQNFTFHTVTTVLKSPLVSSTLK